jgi:hypothetical protein
MKATWSARQQEGLPFITYSGFHVPISAMSSSQHRLGDYHK